MYQTGSSFLNLISMKKFRFHTLDFDTLKSWCGNFYILRTWSLRDTSPIFLVLHFWETKKKKEERRKRRVEWVLFLDFLKQEFES